MFDKVQLETLWNVRADKLRHEHPIPLHTEEGLKRYAVDRLPTGSFLQAVLSNDLKGAVVQADDMNQRALQNIVIWVMNVLPSQAQGSREKYLAWLNPEPNEGGTIDI